MNRAAYTATRRRQRSALDTREDRGLPHHPDGSGWATCHSCEGAGESTHNYSPIGDPQCEYPVCCASCGGRGYVRDGHGPDPLLTMRTARILRRLSPSAAFDYASARRVAMCPVSGLVNADMRAMATRCATAAGQLHQTMRRAA